MSSDTWCLASGALAGGWGGRAFKDQGMGRAFYVSGKYALDGGILFLSFSCYHLDAR